MIDLASLSLPEVFVTLTADGSLARLLALARHEDLGRAGDVTTASLSAGGSAGGLAGGSVGGLGGGSGGGPGGEARGLVIARAAGTIAGLAAGPHVVRTFAPVVTFAMEVDDGTVVEPGATLATLRGPVAEILAAERTLLNLVGYLSGIATATRRAVETVAGTRAEICDTRKTVPGLRRLAKYAVRCGGGTLHRLGLHDAALYKDNHLAGVPVASLAATLVPALERVRRRPGLGFVEIEVDDLEQLDVILGLPAGLVDIVLLDNMPPATLREAVVRRDRLVPAIRLEASGGITQTTLRAVAETGVDRISIGALTHSVQALDVALDLQIDAGGALEGGP